MRSELQARIDEQKEEISRTVKQLSELKETVQTQASEISHQSKSLAHAEKENTYLVMKLNQALAMNKQFKEELENYQVMEEELTKRNHELLLLAHSSAPHL